MYCKQRNNKGWCVAYNMRITTTITTMTLPNGEH